MGAAERDVDITGDTIEVDTYRKHSIAHDEEGAYCSTCSHRQGDLILADWLRIRCMGVHRSGSPIRGPARPIHLTTNTVAMCGQVVLHPSHTLWYYRGQLWCLACGRTAGVSGRSLQEACVPAVGGPSAGSSYRCRQLMAGRLPSGIRQWPDERPHWQQDVNT